MYPFLLCGIVHQTAKFHTEASSRKAYTVWYNRFLKWEPLGDGYQWHLSDIYVRGFQQGILQWETSDTY